MELEFERDTIISYDRVAQVTLCQEEGSIHPSHDPDQVVEELVVLHRGALFEWRIYEGRFDLPQLGRRMARQLLRGLHYAD